MKFVTLVAASCLFAGAAFAASPEQALIDLENGWAKAYVAKDLATIGAILSDDWLGQADGPKRTASPRSSPTSNPASSPSRRSPCAT